jgi:hypothetical protein
MFLLGARLRNTLGPAFLLAAVKLLSKAGNGVA